MIPTAHDMTGAVRGYLQTLLREGLIEHASFSYVDQAFRLVSGPTKKWSYKVNASTPLKFKPIYDSYLAYEIFPVIYLDVEVDDSLTASNIPPFKTLVVTLEVKRLSDLHIIYRAHFDLANKEGDPPAYQPGPLYHVQFGGHSPGGDRASDFRLKIPRWTYPPMDLILVCETIVANFYPDKWNKLKGQRGWLEYIKQSQELCYSRYFEKVDSILSGGRSLLNETWASSWGA